jgi:hypothetical protein
MSESDAKWTPGPWRVDPQYPHDIQAGEGDSAMEIASVCNRDDGMDHWYPPDEQADANARLIAASPDMAEALRELLATAGDGLESASDEDLRGAAALALSEMVRRQARAFLAARAALAKAEGRQS